MAVTDIFCVSQFNLVSYVNGLPTNPIDFYSVLLNQREIKGFFTKYCSNFLISAG